MSTVARRTALGFAVTAMIVGSAAPALAQVKPALILGEGVMSLDQSTGNFCLTEKFVLSSKPRITCHSTAEWRQEGLDITVR